MAWVSPTGFNDPSGDWINEARAYDDKTTTWAEDEPCGGNWLELTLSSPISCDKIRAWTRDYYWDLLEVEIEVYYSDAWHNIFTGFLAVNQFVEKSIGSTEIVSKGRIKEPGGSWCAYVAEFDFNEVEAPPPARRIFITHQ